MTSILTQQKPWNVRFAARPGRPHPDTPLPMIIRIALALAALAAHAAAAPRPSRGGGGGGGLLVNDRRPAYGGQKPPRGLPADPLTFAPLDLGKRAPARNRLPRPFVSTSPDTAAWATRATWAAALAADGRNATSESTRAAAMLAVAQVEAEAAGAVPPPGWSRTLERGQCLRRRDDGEARERFSFFVVGLRFRPAACRGLAPPKTNARPSHLPAPPTSPLSSRPPRPRPAGYNYTHVLRLALDFYHAQRLGPIPRGDPYAVPWRRSSMLGDPFPAHADGGDALVLMFPYGQTLSLLGWAFLPENFRAGYDASPGAAASLRATLRWGAAAVMAAHAGGPTRFIVQVGDERTDHSYWGRPEDVGPGRGLPRPVLELNGALGKNGSDAAGEGAAACAAAALAWRGLDDAFAEAAAAAAESLYAFAVGYEGRFSDGVPVGDMYPSTSYLDDLVWASAWMARLTGNGTYLARASAFFDRMVTEEPGALLSREQSWSVTTPVAAAMLAGLAPDEPKFSAFAFLAVETALQGAEPASYTPAGLAFRNGWGSLRNAANPALVAAVYGRLLRSWAASASAGAAGTSKPTGTAAKPRAAGATAPRPSPPPTPPPSPSSADQLGRLYLCWARGQARYALGDAGRSFVVGWGVNPPTHVHHRAASCPTEVGPPGSGTPPCGQPDFRSPRPNPQVHTGALAGGPDYRDAYTDARSDYVGNEVALDYNAAFSGLLAMLR
jgi:endoglucanase